MKEPLRLLLNDSSPVPVPIALVFAAEMVTVSPACSCEAPFLLVCDVLFFDFVPAVARWLDKLLWVEVRPWMPFGGL